MADEEGEIRRMAEIADAINAILDAEPNAAVGDTPADAATRTASDSVDDVTPVDSPATEDQTSDDQTSEDQTSETDETSISDVVAANDLDAAIAAEFSPDTGSPAEASEDVADGPLGPVPDLSLSEDAPVNRAINQDVLAGSEMADLSIRMQDTLAEIRQQANQAWAGADDLLAEMEAARAALVADIRGQIHSISEATQKRRDVIMAELSELENQSKMARDEMEIMLVKFETSLADLQRRYFANAESEKERLGRYREFLQFLLDERGM